MDLTIYNTMTRQKELFVPLKGNTVRMYVCGPTVYDVSHIGHARKEVVFDVIVRYLRYLNYNVTYVRNITDIDDKIIARAQDEHTSCEEIARRYEDRFHEDMEALRVVPPDKEPRATEHIGNIQEVIRILLDRGFAYVSNGSVYFSVSRCEGYGKLSQRRREEMRAGARVEVDECKEDPLDFALWKASKPGEPRWSSPWGEGRPGWHIECSVMSREFLGDTLDIHGGGLDLIFPHHENEIAQSESATGKTFSRFWVHNGLLSVRREKMSKSLGNFITIGDALQSYHPEVLRFFFLSHHYRSPVDYTEDGMAEARKNIDYFYSTILRIREICGESDESGEVTASVACNVDQMEELRNLENSFVQQMNDDFNTAGALGELFKVNSMINRWIDTSGLATTISGHALLRAYRKKLGVLGTILGVLQENAVLWFQKGSAHRTLSQVGLDETEIRARIRERENAREAKDWRKADTIRDELRALGILLEDTPRGTRWKRT